MGLSTTGASVGAEQATEPPRTERTADGVVGASISHPEAWAVEREDYTFDKTHGFTLWRTGDAAADHGGTPAVRIALAYDLKPGQIDDRVRETVKDYPDLSLKCRVVDVARKWSGVAVGPVPGSTPFTEIYVPVEGRVYKINVYSEGLGEEGLDAEDRALLASLRFVEPSRPVLSLDLPAANSPEALYAPGTPPIRQTWLGRRSRKALRKDSWRAPPSAPCPPAASGLWSGAATSQTPISSCRRSRED